MTIKKISGLIIILLSVFCLSSFAFAQVNDSITVYPASSKVLVNGTPVEFDAYLINGNNYFKLRDIAMAINNTNKGFSVEWDSQISAIILAKEAKYKEAGGELAKGDGKPKQAILSASPVFSDYMQLKMIAYTINGNNFFKLRDIADAMEFNVTWSSSTSTVGINTTGFYGLTQAEKITYKEPVNTGAVLNEKVNDSEFVGYYYGWPGIVQITNDGVYNILKKDGVYQTKPNPKRSVLEPPFKAYNFTKAPYRYGEFGITIMVNTTDFCFYKDDYKVLVITKNNKGVPCAGFTHAEGYFLKKYSVQLEWIGTSLADVEPFLKNKELQKELEKAAKEEKEKSIRAIIDKRAAQRTEIIEQKVNTLDRNSPVTANNFLQGRFMSEISKTELLIEYSLPYDRYGLGYNLNEAKHEITYINKDYSVYVGEATMTVSGDVTTFWIDDDNYVIITAEYGSSITHIKLIINGEFMLDGPIDYRYVDNNLE